MSNAKLGKRFNRTISSRTAAAVFLVLVMIIAAATFGCTATPSTAKKTTVKSPKAKSKPLTIAGEWFTDNQTHLEPMTVTGVNAASAKTLFVVFIASDSGQGPERGGPPLDGKVQSVEGGGLKWTRQAEAHLSITKEPGIAEIWTAYSPQPVSSFTITVTRNNDNGANTLGSNYVGGDGPNVANGMVYVQAITGADPKTPVGATAVAGTGERSGNMNGAAVTLTTTRTGSLVEAVGTDWSGPFPRVMPDGQLLLHESVSTPNGDDYWAQRLTGVAAAPGPVTLSATAPLTNSCNLAAIEILQAP